MPEAQTETDDDPLARHRERLEEVRAELGRLEDREEELEAEIADALAEGRSVNGKRKRRRRVREEIGDLEQVVPILEAKIEDREYTVLRDRAVSRLQSIRRKVGGIAGQVPRRIEEARELQAKLVDILNWLYAAPERVRLLAGEADIIADAFDAARPELQEIEEDPARVAFDLRKGVKKRVTRPRDLLTPDRMRRIRALESRHGDEVEAPELLAELEELEGSEEGGS